MLNVEPSNLVFLKTYNTEFDEVIITFKEQNYRPLEIEIEGKFNLTLPIIKKKFVDILQNQEQGICHRIWLFIICWKI